MSLSPVKMIISTLVFLAFVVGGVLFVHDVETSYSDDNVDMGLDQYINETYFTTTDTRVDSGEDPQLSNTSYELGKDIQGRMFDKEIDDTDTESSMFSGSFSVIRLIPTSINLIGNVMNQVANEIGIPEIFVQIGFSAIVIMVIFGIIFLIFRVKAG